MALNADTLERLVPDEIKGGEHTGQETLDLHLERYRFAARSARPGRVLDLACGVGYGTRILSDHGAGVVSALGVDISADAVAYASQRYANERTSYRHGDALTFADADGFDTVVSLETVEHVPDPSLLVERLIALLKPGGVFISSVPTTPSVDMNPHHLHDFTPRSFRRMLASKGLREIDAFEQVQKVNPIAVASRSESRMKSMRQNLVGYYATHPNAFFRRIGATLRHGFCNKYLTVVGEKA